ncbi:hypothetical protein Csa_017752, partial [Cucumis sativus]
MTDANPIATSMISSTILSSKGSENFENSHMYRSIVARPEITYSVNHGSKKQHTVSRSITEVELCCLANTATEVVWLASLFKELKILPPKQPILRCDNLGVVHLSANPILHSITKHVELDIYFVRDLV